MLLETNENKVTPENPKKKIYIRYYLTVRPAAKNIQEMIDDLFILSETLKKTDTLFIIIKDEPNETLINEIKHIWESEGVFIVIESIKRLQFNILEHILVPPHRVVLESEAIEIMKKYNITSKTQFPDISRFDPVARVIGLRPGQLCHITRPSKTAIEANYYRICL
jgi:DNA-directed RNA polymerase subunit H (RpoH/RPB5)